MDPSTINGENEDDTKHTPSLSLANGSGEEDRNPTTNATTMTNHEKKDVDIVD
jgi:hypothetical protein